MTYEDWLNARSPGPLLRYMLPLASVRQYRLFAVACCRRIWPLVQSKRARWWVESAENLVDGKPILCDVDDLADDECRGQRPVGEWVRQRKRVGRPVPWKLESEWDNYWEAFQHIDGYRQDRTGNFRYYAIRAAHSSIQPEVNDDEDAQRDPTRPRLIASHQYAAEAVAHWRRPDDNAMYDPQAIAEELAGQIPLFWDIFGNLFGPTEFDPRWRTSDVVGLAQAVYEDRVFDRLPILGDALMDAGCDDEQVLAHCRSDGPHVRGCWLVDLILNKGQLVEPAPSLVAEEDQTDEFERRCAKPRNTCQNGR
jgi:hypothetical protein